MCVLSICIPTYDRLDWVNKNVKSLDSVANQDFEIVVVSEPSDQDTETVFQDREMTIRYIENESYLGFPKSILKLVDVANGDFLLFSSDEDYINPEAVSWLIKTIREHDDVTRIATTCDKEGYEVYDPLAGADVRLPSSINDDEGFLLYDGAEAVEVFFFSNKHLTGHLMRREALDTAVAARFTDGALGPYITQVLAAQATLAGKTLYTNRKLWTYGELQITEHDIPYNTKRVRAMQTRERVNGVIPTLIEDPVLRRRLLNQDREMAAMVLLTTVKDQPLSTPIVLWILLTTIPVSISARFWIALPLLFVQFLRLQVHEHVAIDRSA